MKTMQYELKPKVKEFLNEDIKGLYINGEYTSTVTGKTFDVLDPATENVVAKVSEKILILLFKLLEKLLTMKIGQKCLLQSGHVLFTNLRTF